MSIDHTTGFLAEFDRRPLPAGHLLLGPGGLEVAVVGSAARPQQSQIRQAWSARHKGRGVPVLMVCLYDDVHAALCGPGGEEPPVHLDLDRGQVERICRTALGEPDRHTATRFLNSVLAQIGESPIPGLRNEGLFATHELTTGVRSMPEWAGAQANAKAVLDRRGRTLLNGLGFDIADAHQPYSILRAAPTSTGAGQAKLAVAVFLDRTENPDFMSPRFNGMSPVQYALSKAEEENLDYVVVDHGSALRVYTVASSKGVGRRGRSETFVEAHLDLLRTHDAAYLWLLFSAPALVKGGTFDQILGHSHDYATALGTRLRERIYNEVVPKLALAIARARDQAKPTVADLAATYEMALLVLFRLLFVAYAEDKDLLPYRTNDQYRSRSLKAKAHELADLQHAHAGRQTWDDSTSLWDETFKLFGVVDDGKPKQWGVPGYNGGMFSSAAAVSPSGALLKEITLPNSAFGPVLTHLLVDDAPGEGPGPVDFRSLGVREFGTIYEGLLESELSVAETDLYLDADGVYVPTPPRRGNRTPAVAAGAIYLHNLQQCCNVINVDLPWNPMRLVQRHGRVDRIGSPHTDVHLHCFFPDKELDELLELEARIRRKLAQAAASIGVETEVIPGATTHDVVFTETREQIAGLRREDPTLFVNGGEDPNGHSGEEYRQELRRATQSPPTAEAIKRLAWGAGSGLAQGPEQGHFFCARVGDRWFLRFVPLGGETVERNTLRCLKKITCVETTPRHLPPDLSAGTHAAWAIARHDVLLEWSIATDPANIQPRVRPFFRRLADHLRRHPPAAVAQGEVDRAIDSLEAPWGVRHERALREAFRDADAPATISTKIIEKVRELGMEPFVQPQPLPVIGEDEISLICWMAVDVKA